MGKIDSTKSLMNMIMPRMETKKVNNVHDGFKSVFENGNKKSIDSKLITAKNDSKASSDKNMVDERPKFENINASKNSNQNSSEKREAESSDSNISMTGNSKENQNKTLETKSSSENRDGSNRMAEDEKTSGFSEVSEDDRQTEANIALLSISFEKIMTLLQEYLEKNNITKEESLKDPTDIIKNITNELIASDEQLAEAFSKNPQVLKSLEKQIENSLKSKGDSIGSFVQVLEITDQKERSINIPLKAKLEMETTTEKEQPIPPKNDIKADIHLLRKELNNANPTKGVHDFTGLSKNQADILEDTVEEPINFNVNQIKITNINNTEKLVKTIGTERGNFSFAAKVFEEVKISLGQNKTEMHIKLEPETLGKLTIKISSENGIMNASFFAENDKAKLMIENQMAELKRTLESQGIQVQNLSVTVDSGRDELNRHKNIMEAAKYSKVKGFETNIENITAFESVKNPYILDDEFTEII